MKRKEFIIKLALILSALFLIPYYLLKPKKIRIWSTNNVQALSKDSSHFYHLSRGTGYEAIIKDGNYEVWYDFTDPKYAIKNWRGKIIGWKDLSGNKRDAYFINNNK